MGTNAFAAVLYRANASYKYITTCRRASYTSRSARVLKNPPLPTLVPPQGKPAGFGVWSRIDVRVDRRLVWVKEADKQTGAFRLWVADDVEREQKKSVPRTHTTKKNGMMMALHHARVKLGQTAGGGGQT